MSYSEQAYPDGCCTRCSRALRANGTEDERHHELFIPGDGVTWAVDLWDAVLSGRPMKFELVCRFCAKEVAA